MDQTTLLINSLISGIFKGSMYSVVALGVVLIYKCSKIVSFTQGGVLLIGVVTGWLVVEVAGFPLVLGILISLIMSMMLGMAIDRFAMRPIMGQPIIASIMATVALFWFLSSFGILTVAGHPRPFPMFLGEGMYTISGFMVPKSGLWTFLIVMAFYSLFTVFYRFSKIGLYMRGIAEDLEVVQSLGIKVRWILSQTWMIAALTAGIAGILLSNSVGVHMGLLDMGWKGLVVAIVGGLESVLGAFIMGPVIAILEVLAIYYLDPIMGGGMGEIAPFVVLLLMLIFKPYGLFGLKRIERV